MMENATSRARQARLDIPNLRRRIGECFGSRPVARKYLAGLVGASEASVANWEGGRAISASFEAKLSDLDERITNGNLGGIPRPKGRARAAAKTADAEGEGPLVAAPDTPYVMSVEVDVKELRQKLGQARGTKTISRSELARILRVSPTAVATWEAGTRPRGNNREQLQKLWVRASEGRPVATQVAGARHVPGVPAYVNAADLISSTVEVRIRFKLFVPGGDEHVVADLIMAPKVVADLLRAWPKPVVADAN